MGMNLCECVFARAWNECPIGVQKFRNQQLFLHLIANLSCILKQQTLPYTKTQSTKLTRGGSCDYVTTHPPPCDP